MGGLKLYVIQLVFL